MYTMYIHIKNHGIHKTYPPLPFLKSHNAVSTIKNKKTNGGLLAAIGLKYSTIY